MMMTNTRSFDQPQNIVEVLETEESNRGRKAALDLALELLSHELNHLEWKPPVGVALGRWVIARPAIPQTLLHAITSYLALYYPELDETIADTFPASDPPSTIPNPDEDEVLERGPDDEPES